MNLVFNWTTAAMVGVPVLLAWLAFVLWTRQQPSDDVYYDEDTIMTEAELYENVYGKKEQPPADVAFYKPGGYYRWEAVEDLLWSCGYSQEESRALRRKSYVEIWRYGVSAAFDSSGGAYDAGGWPLYWCRSFDPNADTERSDRWRREPSDEERRRAVYR